MKTKNRRISGFTLFEFILLVFILGLLVGVAVPNWLTVRKATRRNICLALQERIVLAKEALPADLRGEVSAEAIIPYIKGKTQPICPSGGTYRYGTVDQAPSCSIEDHKRPELPKVQ